MIFNIPFDGLSDFLVVGSFVSKSISSSRKWTVADVVDGCSGDCVRKRKRRLNEKNRFFEFVVGDIIEFDNKSDDGVSFEIYSWLLVVLASKRERRCDDWLIFSGGAEAKRFVLFKFDVWLAIFVKLSSRATDEPFSDLLKKNKQLDVIEWLF